MNKSSRVYGHDQLFILLGNFTYVFFFFKLFQHKFVEDERQITDLFQKKEDAAAMV